MSEERSPEVVRFRLLTRAYFVTGHSFLTKAATADFAKSLGLSSKDIPAQSWVNRYLDQSAVDTTGDDLYFFPVPKGTKESTKRK